MSAAWETAEGASPKFGALRRGLDGLAAHASRVLSSRAQTRLELALCEVERASLRAIATQLAPFDQAVVLGGAGTGVRGIVLPSRGLAFALLALRFGARPGVRDAAVPERAYTRIEGRTLERTALELWQAFQFAAGGASEAAALVVVLEDAPRLRMREDAAFWLATFTVSGLERVERVCLAIPIGAAPSGPDPSSRPWGGDDAIEEKRDLEREGPRTAAGGAHPTAAAAPSQELSGRTFPSVRPLWLAPGSTLELAPGEPGTAVLRVNGRALARGTLVTDAHRTLLRIAEVLSQGEGEDADAG